MRPLQSYWPLWFGCLLVAVGRFTVPGHGFSWPGTYETIAHLLIGGWLGMWWAGRGRVYLWAVVGLTAFETVMFLLRTP